MKSIFLLFVLSLSFLAAEDDALLLQALNKTKNSRRISVEDVEAVKKKIDFKNFDLSRFFKSHALENHQIRILVQAFVDLIYVEGDVNKIAKIIEEHYTDEIRSVLLAAISLKSVDGVLDVFVSKVLSNHKLEPLYRELLSNSVNGNCFNLYLTLYLDKKIDLELAKKVLPRTVSSLNRKELQFLSKMENSDCTLLYQLCSKMVPATIETELTLVQNNVPEIEVKEPEREVASKMLDRKNLSPNAKDLLALYGKYVDPALEESKNTIAQKIYELSVRDQVSHKAIKHYLNLKAASVREVYYFCEFKIPVNRLGDFGKFLDDLISDNPKARARGLLHMRDTKDKDLFDAFVYFLSDPKGQVREETLSSITMLAEEDNGYKSLLKANQQSILKIVTMLQDGDKDVVITAIQCLSFMNDIRHFNAIVELHKHPEDAVKLAVMDCIAKNEIRSALPAVDKLLQHSKFNIRGRAARIYIEIGWKEIREKEMLNKYYKIEKDEFVKAELKLALAKKEK